MSQVKGICPAIVARFTQTGELDCDSYRSLIRTLIQGGCPGVTLFGIAGEYYKLTDDEARNLIAITVEECKAGEMPSIISVTQHATEVTASQAKYNEDAGADCLMLLPPFFLKPTAENLFDHIKVVCGAVTIPVMVQYAPEQILVAIAPSMLARLGNERENLEYYEVEHRPLGEYVSSLLNATQNRARIFTGNAGSQMIRGFDRGAVGVTPGCSMYDVYLKIHNHYRQGNHQEAIRVHNELLTMLNHIRQNAEMIVHYEKKILNKRGIVESDYCRRPTFKADKVYDTLFEEYFEHLGAYFD